MRGPQAALPGQAGEIPQQEGFTRLPANVFSAVSPHILNEPVQGYFCDFSPCDPGFHLIWAICSHRKEEWLLSLSIASAHCLGNALGLTGTLPFQPRSPALSGDLLCLDMTFMSNLVFGSWT